MIVEQKVYDILGSDETTNALFKAIGFIVVQWGQAEQSLDLLVAAMLQKHNGSLFLQQKKRPMMLKPKLQFLQKCFTGMHQLEMLALAGEQLVAEFNRLSKIRHDFVHGAVADLSSSDAGFTFLKLDITNGDSLEVREVRLEAKDFPTLALDLVALGASAVNLAQRVWTQPS